MTKKCFAMIKTANENAAKIKELTDVVLSGSCTKAYKAIKEIAALNEKFIKDFGDVDPYWSAKTAEQQTQAQTPAINYNYQQ